MREFLTTAWEEGTPASLEQWLRWLSCALGLEELM
jgi:hypothetical protein